MKQYSIVPTSCWPCTLLECPPGLFEFDGIFAVKSEYYQSDPEKMEVFLVDGGEFFWGGADNYVDRAKLIVQPCIIEFKEAEDYF